MDTSITERLLEAINTHDLEALVACFVEDYSCEFPVHPARGFQGRAHVRKNWSQIFAMVPDISASVAGHAVMGDEVWSEWRMAGHTREGGSFDQRGVIILVVKNQTIVRSRFYMEPFDGSARPQ
jgi:ketosteroid isomerase-like protein